MTAIALQFGTNHVKGAFLALIRSFAGISVEEAAKLGGLTNTHLSEMERGITKTSQEYNHMYGVYMMSYKSCRDVYGTKSWEHWMHDLCSCIRVHSALHGYSLPDFVDTTLSVESTSAMGSLLMMALVDVHGADLAMQEITQESKSPSKPGEPTPLQALRAHMH